jgi:hypothetical protein
VTTTRQAERERRNQWNFFTSDDGLWLWRVVFPEGGEAKSKKSFDTLSECIQDAKSSGFVMWTERERRQAS